MNRSKRASRLLALMRRPRLGEDGISAVEFALFAPMLFFALLAMVDLGLAIYERMTVDHVLRAGAQEAMEDPGPDKVLDVLNTTAEKNFVAEDAPVFTVDYPVCACPNDNEVAVVCSTTCPGPTATSIYYHLRGQKTYEGMIIPQISLGPSVRVQVR